MRLRNDPKAKEFLSHHTDIFIDHNPEAAIPIEWAVLFENNNPLYLEIGMGKGQFIIAHALKYPEINFVGLEMNEVICSKAVKKYLCLENKINNLKFIKANAKNLNMIFNHQSLSKIFLNFSDPWPKKRHAKNRLTSPAFLSIYEQLLIPGGQIEFKSDNESLFAYTLETLQDNPSINIDYSTTDLYAHLDSEINIDNIPTEYEQKFSILKNINKVIFSFKKFNNCKL